MQKKSLSGFSLIELMIVVTIMGILSAIALPSYHGYVRRARFAEIIAATASYKIAVALALQQDIPMADLKNGAHGIPLSPTPTTNLTSVTVENGVITATASPRLDNLTFILTPKEDGSAWSIKGSCISAGLCND